MQAEPRTLNENQLRAALDQGYRFYPADKSPAPADTARVVIAGAVYVVAKQEG